MVENKQTQTCIYISGKEKKASGTEQLSHVVETFLDIIKSLGGVEVDSLISEYEVSALRYLLLILFLFGKIALMVSHVQCLLTPLMSISTVNPL